MSFRGSRTRPTIWSLPTTLRTRENVHFSDFEIQFSIDRGGRAEGLGPARGDLVAFGYGTCRPADPGWRVARDVRSRDLSGAQIRAGESRRLRALCFSVAEAAGVSPDRLTSPLSGDAEAYAVQPSTILPQSPRRMVSNPSRKAPAGRRWVMTLRTLSPLSSIEIILCQVSNISRP